MQLTTTGRVLGLHAAAKRLGIPERTLRYRLASFREAGMAIGGRR